MPGRRTDMKIYDREGNRIGYLNAEDLTVSTDARTESSHLKEEHKLSIRHDLIAMKALRDMFFWLFASEIIALFGFFMYFQPFIPTPECFGSFVSLSVRLIAACFLFYVTRTDSPILVTAIEQYAVAVVVFWGRKTAYGIPFLEFHALNFFCEAGFLCALFLTYRGYHKRFVGKETENPKRKKLLRILFLLLGVIAASLLFLSLYQEKNTHSFERISFFWATKNEIVFSSAWLIYIFMQAAQFLLAGMKLSEILKKETMSI